jgi:hypothetical protein
MPITLKINGEVWNFSTAAEAASFKLALSAAPEEPASPPQARRRSRNRPGRVAKTTLQPRTARIAASASVQQSGAPMLSVESRNLLEVVRHLPEEGVRSEDFARLLQLEGPRSIPIRMMNLGRELKGLGFKPEEVVQRKRIYVKGRGKSVFMAGPRLDDALRKPGQLFPLVARSGM